LPDHFFNLQTRNRFWLFFPVRFGTAKVETFFSFPKLIFFIFLSPGAGLSFSLYPLPNPLYLFSPASFRTSRSFVCGLQRYADFWILQMLAQEKALVY
jgi:hypothetical protein